MIRKIKSFIILVAIAHSIIACSYMADYIEGELTNRASFSITARFVAGTGVIVEWDIRPNQDSFAGYEIYMTKETNNEFADMIVVGAPYDIGSSSFFQLDSGLDNSSENSFTHLNTYLPSPGIYFYRVGIIDWDERDYDDDGEKEKKPDSPSMELYESYTNISEISGSAMVEIQ